MWRLSISVLLTLVYFAPTVRAGELQATLDTEKGTIVVTRAEETPPILTQHARLNFRPYLHPILAPDGRGELTEYSPGHHKHQTGLYWGFTRVNGRDYFHHPGGTYWKRKSFQVLTAKGTEVKWETIYDLLDADGSPVLTESQTWTMQASDSEYLLNLIWKGTAQTDVTIGKYNYGGLFLRMPWKPGRNGDAMNSTGQKNGQAEGQRDAWVDVGMQVTGREDQAHIAIFDHPQNKGFPLPWRVDGQLGVGPVRARLGDWHIEKDQSETIRHQFVIYTGQRNSQRLNKLWSEYTGLKERPTAQVDSEAATEPNPFSLLVKTLGETDNPQVQKALLQGLLDGLDGRRNVTPPKEWATVSAKLAASEDTTVRDLSQRLSQIFGDKDAAAKALAVVRDRTAKVTARRIALHSLLNQQNKAASDLLEALLDDPAMALDAIRGYATVENAVAPAVLLSRYAKLSPEHKRAVIETLATRKPYAIALLNAVEQKKIARDAVPSHVTRSLHILLGDRFEQVFGKWKPVAEDREKTIARYKQIITPAALAQADASRGRLVYKKTCASCHVMYDDGGKIGPELTGSNRANLDYILLNSVDPSYDVPDAYKTVTIATTDGRTANGVLAEEDDTRIVLKTVEQPRLVIAKENIALRKISPKSMMPDGQLDKMKPQEVIDLIKYLRTTEQVEVAE